MMVGVPAITSVFQADTSRSVEGQSVHFTAEFYKDLKLEG